MLYKMALYMINSLDRRCTKSRKFDSFSLRRSAYLRGLCVEMAVKRRDAKIRRRTAEKIHPKNSLSVQSRLDHQPQKFVP